MHEQTFITRSVYRLSPLCFDIVQRNNRAIRKELHNLLCRSSSSGYYKLKCDICVDLLLFANRKYVICAKDICFRHSNCKIGLVN